MASRGSLIVNQYIPYSVFLRNLLLSHTWNQFALLFSLFFLSFVIEWILFCHLWCWYDCCWLYKLHSQQQYAYVCEHIPLVIATDEKMHSNVLRFVISVAQFYRNVFTHLKTIYWQFQSIEISFLFSSTINLSSIE